MTKKFFSCNILIVARAKRKRRNARVPRNLAQGARAMKEGFIMTTINLTNKNNNKVTRVDALNYAIEHLNDAPADVMEKLAAIRDSFNTKPARVGESKTAKENKMLAVALVEYVRGAFDESDPLAINSKAISNNVPGITTTQKAVAVANVAITSGEIVKFKANGRTYYAPAGVEIIG